MVSSANGNPTKLSFGGKLDRKLLYALIAV